MQCFSPKHFFSVLSQENPCGHLHLYDPKMSSHSATLPHKSFFSHSFISTITNVNRQYKCIESSIYRGLSALIGHSQQSGKRKQHINTVLEKTVPMVMGNAFSFGFEPYSRPQAQCITIRTSSRPTKLIFTIKDILEVFYHIHSSLLVYIRRSHQPKVTVTVFSTVLFTPEANFTVAVVRSPSV